MASAGYSGTPLAQKLSLKPRMRTLLCNAPDHIRDAIDPTGLQLELLAAPSAGIEAAHLFVTERVVLERELAALRQLLSPSGFIWVSWPKRASKVPTDIIEDTIRDIALPMGLVDVKVCAVDDVWSGLKLMIRRELR